ncbi:MAG TPA: response regulator transcription factor [Bacteroidales bacterium]|nr:response regulator transcription factor [Bacteroidales bacterium]HOK99742.1 response regulator transcription factor [Bacteroidales bacterium]HPO65981.1 response regulator transcription factor [Bacteroidales bacterium]
MDPDRLIRIVLADDHTLFRNGLKLLLLNNSDMQVVGEASDGNELLALLTKVPCDVVLMDIEMPGLNGFDATQIIAKQYPHTRVISLSMYGEEEYYYRMIEAGARGFLLKSSEINEVSEAIRRVAKGETYFSSEILYNVVKNIQTVVSKVDNALIHLSQREKEVLELICRGMSNQEIADQLFISKRTVEKHRANLLAKTNTKNTAQLVMFAVENKLIE